MGPLVIGGQAEWEEWCLPVPAPLSVPQCTTAPPGSPVQLHPTSSLVLGVRNGKYVLADPGGHSEFSDGDSGILQEMSSHLNIQRTESQNDSSWKRPLK